MTGKYCRMTMVVVKSDKYQKFRTYMSSTAIGYKLRTIKQRKCLHINYATQHAKEQSQFLQTLGLQYYVVSSTAKLSSRENVPAGWACRGAFTRSKLATSESDLFVHILDWPLKFWTSWSPHSMSLSLLWCQWCTTYTTHLSYSIAVMFHAVNAQFARKRRLKSGVGIRQQAESESCWRIGGY